MDQSLREGGHEENRENEIVKILQTLETPLGWSVLEALINEAEALGEGLNVKGARRKQRYNKHSKDQKSDHTEIDDRPGE